MHLHGEGAGLGRPGRAQERAGYIHITDAIIDDEITVNITVSDVAEKPAAPTVTVTSLVDGTTLTVTWDEPENTGPDITGYRGWSAPAPMYPTTNVPRIIATSSSPTK